MQTAVTVLHSYFSMKIILHDLHGAVQFLSDNATLKMGEDKFEEEKFMKALVNLKDTQESIQVRQ